MASSDDFSGVADALKSLSSKCSLQLQIDKGNELLISSKGVCEKLLQQVEKKEEITLADCLQGYAQACLDFTYVDENLLVEEEFIKPTTDERIRTVFDEFDLVLKLASDLVPEKKIIDVLTPDLYECILWRKGALLYMYCSCVAREDTKPKGDNFTENLENGIELLQSMLKVQVPITESQEEVVFNDIQTLQLLQSGLFSDVHVLALMYSGEMCYWHQKYSTNSSDFDAKTVGVKLLEDYISAVQGPLSGKGWNCDRAAELLKSLKDT